jgi:hypothetical protein
MSYSVFVLIDLRTKIERVGIAAAALQEILKVVLEPAGRRWRAWEVELSAH